MMRVHDGHPGPIGKAFFARPELTRPGERSAVSRQFFGFGWHEMLVALAVVHRVTTGSDKSPGKPLILRKLTAEN